VPLPRHSAKFFLFFLNNFFAECPYLGTRQRISEFFLKKYFAECRGEALGKEILYFVSKIFAECLAHGTRQRPREL